MQGASVTVIAIIGFFVFGFVVYTSLDYAERRADQDAERNDPMESGAIALSLPSGKATLSSSSLSSTSGSSSTLPPATLGVKRPFSSHPLFERASRAWQDWRSAKKSCYVVTGSNGGNLGNWQLLAIESAVIAMLSNCGNDEMVVHLLSLIKSRAHLC